MRRWDDLFVTREAAEAELHEILEDEPEWANVLRVVPIELDGRGLVGELVLSTVAANRVRAGARGLRPDPHGARPDSHGSRVVQLRDPAWVDSRWGVEGGA